ncbi:MAG: restriction endonuclease subunit S [Microcoleus vaginatus WJT46-NPBG5]|jgi:type I restriction enzyme S subunit|nr:restriction endonuclease subunit S [Microcoleus vaginatus WJT46-NPBG5]
MIYFNQLPSNWKIITLGELSTLIQYGLNATAEQEGEGFLYLRISDINDDGSVNLANPKYLSKKTQDVSKYILEPGDLIIARSGSVGRSFVYQSCQEPWVFASYLIRFRIRQDIADPDYVGLFMRSPTYRRYIDKMSRSVAQANINSKELSKLPIPLPPLPEQKRIVAILREVDEICRLRKQANEKAKQLLYSFFQEMFGDPSTNPKGWSYGTLRDVVNSVQDGPHVSPKYSHEGIPFLSTRNVRAGEIIWENLKFISRQDAERQWKKCKPVVGDILYTKGGTTGLAKVIDFDIEIAVWVHIALLKLDRIKVNPLWLENMLNSRFCYEQSQLLTHGIANRDLGITRIPNIKIYIPPLSLQEEFAAQAQEIRETISKQVEALTKADDLFQSLLAQAFTGELTATWREQHQEELAAVAECDRLLQISQSVDIEELADEKASENKRVELHRDRKELLRNLSQNQRKIYELVIQETVYFTPEYLEEKYSISYNIGQKSLQLLAATGLIVPVTLPAPTSSGLRYELAYRNLNQDDTQSIDVLLLTKDAV